MSADAPDLPAAYISGQQIADVFLQSLAKSCPTGDDLYRVVAHHTLEMSDERAAFVRGFLRTIQKRLEKLS